MNPDALLPFFCLSDSNMMWKWLRIEVRRGEERRCRFSLIIGDTSTSVGIRSHSASLEVSLRRTGG